MEPHDPVPVKTGAELSWQGAALGGPRCYQEMKSKSLLKSWTSKVPFLRVCFLCSHSCAQGTMQWQEVSLAPWAPIPHAHPQQGRWHEQTHLSG